MQTQLKEMEMMQTNGIQDFDSRQMTSFKGIKRAHTISKYRCRRKSLNSTIIAMMTILAMFSANFLEAEAQVINGATRSPTFTFIPTTSPTFFPTTFPTSIVTNSPTRKPTNKPSDSPAPEPTSNPTFNPTNFPTLKPTPLPTTQSPTKSPTAKPTPLPTTKSPTKSPTAKPTPLPTTQPPSKSPSLKPTLKPTTSPTLKPTFKPTFQPTAAPVIGTKAPTFLPTKSPTKHLTVTPTKSPTRHPSSAPSMSPSTTHPTIAVKVFPTLSPTNSPTISNAVLSAQGFFSETTNILILAVSLCVILSIVLMLAYVVKRKRRNRQLRANKNNKKMKFADHELTIRPEPGELDHSKTKMQLNPATRIAKMSFNTDNENNFSQSTYQNRVLPPGLDTTSFSFDSNASHLPLPGVIRVQSANTLPPQRETNASAPSFSDLDEFPEVVDANRPSMDYENMSDIYQEVVAPKLPPRRPKGSPPKRVNLPAPHYELEKYSSDPSLNQVYGNIIDGRPTENSKSKIKKPPGL